jgi:5'-nucleotidase
MKSPVKFNRKWIAPSLLACALAAGCSNKKNTTPQASALPPMNQAALNVPVGVAAAPPVAPPAEYMPPAPPQPVVYDPPADPPASEEVVEATDSYAEPIAPPRPRKATASRASASLASGKTRYKVKKGESLWSIAQARYGNGNKWKMIAAANPKIDPNRVQAGQTITLP